MDGSYPTRSREEHHVRSGITTNTKHKTNMETTKSKIPGFVRITCDKNHYLHHVGSDEYPEIRDTTVPEYRAAEWEETNNLDGLGMLTLFYFVFQLLCK